MSDVRMPGTYVPGSCNLGRDEIRRRYRIGYIGTGVTILLAFVIELAQMQTGFKFLLFIPIFYAVSGFVQARHKFCYVYGYKGVFSIKGRKVFERTKEEGDVGKDRRTAQRLLLMITIISAILTLLFYYIPSL
ncbi:MAG: hypothetical protein ABIQ11_00065 [Saprospiraceae bacterium]